MRLTIDALHLSWGDRQVLRGASAEFEAPQRVAVMGPSGAGKSTLLAIIAGHLAPDRGSLRLSHATKAEWVVQASPLLAHRTVLDNVMLGALSRSEPVDSAESRAHEAMSRLAIEPLAGVRAHRLSGGERQRVAIARAMTARAELVLADEPTASLDSASKRAVIAALARLSDTGALLIVATHDDEVAAACDRVLRLVDGELREHP